MSHLGSDFSCLEDLDANLTPVEGRFALAQASGRRLITPTGGLFYASDYGDDVRRYLNSQAPSTPLRAAATAEGECEKDERVNRCDVTTTQTSTAAGDMLSLQGSLTDDDGPFDFTLNIDGLSAELLIEAGEV